MATRIVRRHESRWALTLSGAVAIACAIAGYALGRRLFDPGPAGPGSTGEPATAALEPASHDQVANNDPPDTRDAGAAAPRSDAGMAAAVPISTDAGAATEPDARGVTVPVRIVRSFVQSCGDGEELDLVREACAPIDGLAEIVSQHLASVLATCPSAEAAASNPDARLSIGIRLDFVRRRISTLPGRSSSVRDALTFVPCVAARLGEIRGRVFALTTPHPRYLYFFLARFGPMPATRTTETASPPPVPERSPRTPAGSTPSLVSPRSAASDSTGPVQPDVPTRADPSVLPADAVPFRRPEPAVVVEPRAFVRDAPRTGRVLARLAVNTRVTLLARSGSWLQIRFGRDIGWIYARLVRQE